MLGVAVLASIFARTGGYEPPAIFNDGLVPALWVGAAAAGVDAVVALLIPRKRRPFRGCRRSAQRARRSA